MLKLGDGVKKKFELADLTISISTNCRLISRGNLCHHYTKMQTPLLWTTVLFLRVLTVHSDHTHFHKVWVLGAKEINAQVHTLCML